MAQRVEPKPVRQPTPDDEFQAWATRQAALAMGEWLIEGGVLEKRVRQLVLADLEHLASTAISRWIVLKSEREQQPPPPPPPILLGA